MNPENTNPPEPAQSKPAESVSVPPPPPFNTAPPPTPASSVPPPPLNSPPLPSAPSSPPTAAWQHWLQRLFPSHLWTAYKGATSEQMLRLYGWRVAGLLLLLVLLVKFTYTLFSLLLAISLLGLLVGLLNPESFRSLFGEKTSKSTVGWTFGGLACVCALVAGITEPKSPSPVPRAVASNTVSKPNIAVGMGQGVETAKSSGVAPSAKPAANPAVEKPRVVTAPKPNKPKPVVKLTPQQTIEGLMEKQFGKRLRSVKVTNYADPKSPRGNYDVKVEFDISQRWNARTTRGYMDGDMQDAYKAIFNSGYRIMEAGIQAYSAVTDKFGQPFSTRVYHTVLDGEVAEQINWDNYRAAKWEELWGVVFIHTVFRTENLDRDWAKEEADAKKSVEPEEVEREMQKREREGRWPYN